MNINMKTLNVESDSSISSFNTIHTLYQLLKDNIEKSYFSTIQQKFEPDVSMLFNYFNNEVNNPEYNSSLAILELQAIMLRLSRHHIKKAKMIDNISRFFNELFAYCMDKHILSEINFIKSELIDRPSLMIINRSIQLLEQNSIGIKFNFSFSKQVLGKNNHEGIVKIRTQLFEKLSKTINFVSAFPDNLSELTDKDFNLKEEQYSKKILDAAIIEQNFELAYFIVNKSLNSDKNNKIISDQLAYRNLGVIEANIGDFERAIKYFDYAIGVSENIIEYSRNSYIKGLCLIKRLKKVEDGIEILEKALEKLCINYKENDFKYKHERAWLINGICLGKTILANKLKGKERETTLYELIKEEMKAYKMLQNESSFYLVYLKFNLLANIAFLLEILEEYQTAIQFWEKAFAPILANDAQNREGEKSVTYRLGILNIKLGNYEQAEFLLERSLLLARNENNKFHINVILYSLIYVKLLNNRSKNIIDSIIEGKSISIDLNDKKMSENFESSIDCYNGNISISELMIPDVKLISYIPQIDLAFVPEIDLNKHLTTNVKEKYHEYTRRE